MCVCDVQLRVDTAQCEAGATSDDKISRCILGVFSDWNACAQRGVEEKTNEKGVPKRGGLKLVDGSRCCTVPGEEKTRRRVSQRPNWLDRYKAVITS